MWNLPLRADAPLEDFRRYPGCRLELICFGCAWAKSYDPERIIDRLRELHAGGWKTPISAVAQKVKRPCPKCGQTSWTTRLAYPSHMTEREAVARMRMVRN